METINYISIYNTLFSERDLNFFREVSSLRSQVVVQVINKCVSSNDLTNVILFLHKVNYIDFQTFDISQIETILQIILPFLQKFYKNNHFCTLAMTLLYKVYNHIPNCQNIFQPYSDLFLEIFLHYKNSPKFLSKNKPRNFLEFIGNYATMTLSNEAYTNMRNEIYEQLIYHYQECNPKNNILIELTAYLPFEYIDNDPELQHAYFNLFLSKRTSVHCISLVFSKILQNNSTPKIDMKLFIKCFFQKCSVILPYLESKSNPSKGKDDNIDLIMIYLLFNETYLEHLSFTEKCFQIYINQIISLFDDSNPEVAVKLIKRFFKALCFIMCKKEYNDNKREYQMIIYNITNGQILYQRLWYIIKKFFLNIIEHLFYHKIKQANCVLSIIFELLSHSGNISNFDILPWFTILNQICQDKYNDLFYFKKFRTVIPYLLSQVKYNSQYESFIRNSVEQMISYIPRNINELTKQIYKNLSILYINCSEIKNTFNHSYDSLFLFLEEKSIDIIKKTLPLLKQLNKEKSFPIFQIFTFSLTKFASNKTIDNIKKISTKYILKKKDANLPQYGMDLIVNYHEIFDYVFNKMISIDLNRIFGINSYCLYKDERIKHLSLKLLKHETKQFIFNLKNVFDFDRTQLKLYKDRIYLFIYALVNDYNEKKITFIRHILTFVFSLITINYEDTGITKLFKPKVEYPSKEEVTFVVNLFKDIIIPYENYISINNIDEIDEHIIKIYLLYISCLPVYNNNLYMIIDNIKTKDNESSELQKLYQELKSLIGNSISFTRSLLQKIKNKNAKIQSIKMLMETFYDEEQSYFYVKHYNQPIKKFTNLIEFIKNM